MRDVSKCIETKAFPTDAARSSGLGKAVWVEGVCGASHLLDETREKSVLTQARSAGLPRGMDAFFPQLLSMTVSNDIQTHIVLLLNREKKVSHLSLSAFKNYLSSFYLSLFVMLQPTLKF